MENQFQENQSPINLETSNVITLTRKDYFLITFIGISFALFSVPIINNLDLPFAKISIALVISLVIFFAVFANIALLIASIIGKKIPVIFQFAKFAAVGAFNTFLDWGIMNLLIALTGIAGGIGFSVFKGFSFLIATIGSFFWNKYWTFGAKENSDPKEVQKFVIISGIGIIINVTLASLVVRFLGGSLSISPEKLANLAAALATIVSLIWNFVGYKIWVFKK